MSGGTSLHVVMLLDQSGSMRHDGKIQALNTAVSETLPHLERLSQSRPATLSAITFASDAKLHLEATLTTEPLRWEPIEVVPAGLTETGLGITMAIERIRHIGGDLNAVVLVSDGRSTDTAEPSFETALAAMRSLGSAFPITRTALGLGRDVDVAELESFMDGHGSQVCEQPLQLVAALRKAVIQMSSGGGGE